jgi:hypothetical protein
VRTSTEIQTEIDYLVTVRLELATGKTVNKLTIGNGDSTRSYEYQEIDINLIERLLAQLRNELEGEADVLSGFTSNLRTHTVHVRRNL